MFSVSQLSVDAIAEGRLNSARPGGALAPGVAWGVCDTLDGGRDSAALLLDTPPLNISPVGVDGNQGVGGVPNAPPTNRGAENRSEGVEGVRLSLDWLSMTVRPTEDAPVDVPQVQLAASLALGCDPGDWTETERGGQGYQRGMVAPGGAKLWWDGLHPDGSLRSDIHVSLPGQACQAGGREGLLGFLRFGLAHGGKATRCDVAIDDYERVVSPTQVLEAVQGPDVVTHAKKYQTQQGGAVGSSALTGVTVYLGAPQSRQRLRVYDKGLESGGEKDCVRWELEVRKEAAETMAVSLANRDWGQVMSGRLVGFVDFRDAGAHSEVEKRPRLEWFQALVGMAEKASAYLPKPARTARELVDWVDRAIAPSLAVVMSVFQGDVGRLAAMVDRGKARWKPRHHAMVAEGV